MTVTRQARTAERARHFRFPTEPKILSLGETKSLPRPLFPI